MSKIARIPIAIKEGVNLEIQGSQVKVTGPKGTLSFEIPRGIKAKIVEGKIVVEQDKENNPETRALFGLTRAQIANLITGVSDGFEKKLELSGVGFRGQAAGNTLTLFVGFSHPVKITQEGVIFAIAENVITVSGIDKSLVGNIAAKVRGVRPPEPYKGKGIKYVGERIRRKAGKAAKAIGTAKA